MICQYCKKTIETPDYGDGVLDYSDVYEYRGFNFHEACFDEGIKVVDSKRNQMHEVIEHSTRSQLDGQWANGGYKTMKTDPHTGKPMGKVKEPQILQDYEKGIL